MHPSVTRLWLAFLNSEHAPPGLPLEPTSVFHFCDNAVDANECAELARLGRKRATAPSVWGFEVRGEALPSPGDYHIVTDWNGVARCVIRTTSAQVVAFNDVSAEHAAAEGEGDGSLEAWRVTHWAYYQRELAGTSHGPAEDMPVVCEEFATVYPPLPDK